ncbi:cell wall hydrolase [Lachnoclostridium phytofermentans]|uniref:Cell wall hydrolase SleB n=1 Tax=Lachnoclostridium phytofermentans (strain ATCC 700394 / DSM 18823 / ISDg) TaxID=357809 RepID=A9KQ47_LACP7|nr:cell wall hydrolase [Lachnoclostridium phytofermentans]ABX43359.1 cell wall hydrolase SleB [Lachnoclostridium phytofermentans ISDg]
MKAKTRVSVILVMIVCFFAMIVITDTTCYSISGTYEDDSQIAETNTSDDEANQLDFAKSKEDEFAKMDKIELFSLAIEDNSSDNLITSNHTNDTKETNKSNVNSNTALDSNVSLEEDLEKQAMKENLEQKVIKENLEEKKKQEDLEQKAVQENVKARAIAFSMEENVADSNSNSEEIDTFSMIKALPEYEKVLPKVSEFLNIRSEADSDATIVGQLNKNSYATIVERGEEWTKITSGKVTGYASNQYLYFDEEAKNLVSELKADQIVITAGSVNIRKSPDLTGEVLTEAKNEDSFVHVSDEDTDGWYAIQYKDSQVSYVSKDLSKSVFNLKTATTKEEIEEAKKTAQIAKELEEAKKHKPSKTNRSAIKVSDEEILLLATVVAMEANGESYEGQLAVANVVVNRMIDGYWGKTIHDVIYAPGQFSGANSGRVEKYKSQVTESCKKAAIEALAGNNNIGDYKYFMMKNRAKTSSYKKYYILGSHCFYQR